MCTPFPDFSRLESATKVELNRTIGKGEELSFLFNKMSFITDIDEMGDVKIENKRDLKNVMQSARRRSLPILTIPQTERWIQDTEVESNINYLSNSDATNDVNEVPTVRTRK